MGLLWCSPPSILSPLTSLPFPLAGTQLRLFSLLAPLRSLPSPLFLLPLLSPPSPLPSTHHRGANRRTPWPLASNAIFTTQILSLVLDFPFLCWLLSNLYFWATCEGCRRDWESIEKIIVKNFFVFCKIIAKKFVNTLSLCLFFPTFYFKFIVGNLWTE